MEDVAVHIEDLGKKYHIGAVESRRDTLRDTLTEALMAPLRRARQLLGGHASAAADLHETIWALKDISLDVPRGQVLGIIGANGAGKSTLLKVVSRITEPTEGMAEIRGRVGSLLEVGTGFHKELTGRENVYLNGAVLGMTRDEIEQKFDQIVSFAEVERFIDTPIKHFSSGMKVRLAFAVAAHLEPEILVIDEVLSVGDAAFQQKCLGKMGEVSSQGRTVLFVSHNMSAVNRLCDRAILLKDGRQEMDGPPRRVVSTYLKEGAETSGSWKRPEDGPGDLEAVIDAVRVRYGDVAPAGIVPFDEPFELELQYRVRERMRDFSVEIRVEDEQGSTVFATWDSDSTEWGPKERPLGSYVSRCRVPAGMLRPGRYYLTVGSFIKTVKYIEERERVLAFDVSEVGYPFNPDRHGVITPLLEWDVERQDAPRAVSAD